MKVVRNMRVGGVALALVLSGLVLTGCGERSDQSSAAKGQVVARIGKEVVTIQELENEMRLANILPDKQKDPEIVKRVLGEIVVRKYLFQQAMDAKLDREPGILLDLLRVREQVLGNAVLNRGAAAKPSGRADVDRYIAKNTYKFADRKLYGVDQLILPLSPAAQTFVNANKDARSLDDLQQQLSTSGIPFARQAGGLSSSDLPEDLAAAVQRRKDSDVFFTRAGSNGVFFKVRSEEARPLEGDAAVNFARQAMRSDAIAAELGLASYSARLEAKYEGDYAELMK